MYRALTYSVRTVVRSATACLRVIALAYTGLGALAAVGLVVSVAVMPSAPMLQQVGIEPARQAPSSVLPPTADLFGGPPVRLLSGTVPAPAPFAAFSTPGLTIADSPPSDDGEEAAQEPVETITEPTVASRSAVYVVAQPITREPAAEPAVVDEDPAEEPILDEAPAGPGPAETAVVEPAATPVLQIATVSAPKALPTPEPSPKDLKARTDAANQAAIDAAKVAKAQAKAEADAANQAAIDALKRSTAETTAPAMADAVLSLPTSAPTQTAAKQAKAAADAYNQAAIDAAKAAAARAKAEADAANQAAIDAARAARTPKR